MNTMAFTTPTSTWIHIASAVFLILSTATSLAATPPAEKPQHQNQLVLTLPDQWSSIDNQSLTPNSEANNTSSNLSHQQRAVNVDCGMEANPLDTYDSSMSNRLQGKCNLGYRY